MINGPIHTLLREVLGEFSFKSKGNISFFCPFCKHYKQKLEVHPERGQWNCWVCGTKGKSLYALFRRLQVSNVYFERLYKLQPKTVYLKDLQTDDTVENIELPKEYIPLWIPQLKNFYYKTAINYLNSRNITIDDIFKYRIGYAEGGIYDGMLLFPNYNKMGKLTYVTNRSFLMNNSSKFINPPYGRNIIGLELQLNYDLPLIICESALDAYTIKINPTPLYGKFLSKALRLAILENEVKDIIMCLDPDAINKSYEHSEYFINNGINVRIVEIPKDKDANSLGYDKIWKLIDKSKLINYDELFYNKVKTRMGIKW